MRSALERLTARLDALDLESLDAPEEERRAAVAMILRVERSAEVLLMRRREHPEDRWSGQISLPGGHQDATDADLVATAMRETREEVGVDLERSARLVGRLPRIQARARGRTLPIGITPYVFTLTETVAPVAGEEAQEVFWFPLDRAHAGELDEEFRYTRDDGLIRRLPSWRHEERVVWGLTHHMLSALLGHLA